MVLIVLIFKRRQKQQFSKTNDVVFKTNKLGRFLDKTAFSSVLKLLILGKSLPNFLIKKLKKKGRKKKEKEKTLALWTGIHKPNAKIY